MRNYYQFIEKCLWDEHFWKGKLPNFYIQLNIFFDGLVSRQSSPIDFDSDSDREWWFLSCWFVLLAFNTIRSFQFPNVKENRFQIKNKSIYVLDEKKTNVLLNEGTNKNYLNIFIKMWMII